MSDDDLINRFTKEVINSGPESTLPCNLSDEWLDLLSDEADSMGDDSDGSRITELLAAVLHILFTKNGGQEIELSEDEMFGYVTDYQMELAIEVVGRRTDVKTTPASMKTIFTNRDVGFSTG